jgi:6-phosphogluconolactonase
VNKAQAHVFVGSYTPPWGKGAGIYRFELDVDGGLRPLGVTVGVHNPTYLAAGRSSLYATVRLGGRQAGLASFAVTGDDADLRFTGLAPIGQQALCYVRLSLAERCALVASFTGGTVALFPLDGAGRPRPVACEMAHRGRGHDPVRQGRPHPHSIVPSPGGRFALVADLGTDRVVSYRLQQDSLLSWHGETRTGPGAGPRHLVFHPDGRHAFVSNELDSTVSAYLWSEEAGLLEPVHTAPTVPHGATEANRPADIKVHPSGRFVYVSNRGEDSIAGFAVDPGTGRLEYIGSASTLGVKPRCFEIDASGRWLLAANQDSGTVTCFQVDPANGTLLAAGQQAEVPNPGCVLITDSQAGSRNL